MRYHNWTGGKPEDIFNIDHIVDTYILAQIYLDSYGYYDKAYYDYFIHCLDCIGKAFDFHIIEAIDLLPSKDASILSFYVNKSREITVPMRGAKYRNTYAQNITPINDGVSDILKLYKSIIKLILQSEYKIKESVERQDILNAGYNEDLIPKLDEDYFTTL